MSRLPFELLLALRYLRPKRTFVSVITLISVLGVTLGVAVLIIVISVMTGFDREMRTKILGFNAHLKIMPRDRTMHDYPAVAALVRSNANVTGVAPFVLGQVLLETHPAPGQQSQVTAPWVRGVDPELERQVSTLTTNIISGSFDLSGRGIVLGRELADSLGLMVGDRVSVYSPRDIRTMRKAQKRGKEQAVLPDDYEVRGVFDSGWYEFNATVIVAALENAQEFYALGDNVHGLIGSVRDPFQAGGVARALGRQLGPSYRVTYWMEDNPLMVAVMVEKNLMLYILFFIVVVAAFGITCTLITFVVMKTAEVGLLKAIGATDRQVMLVFLMQSLIVSFAGIALGVLSGLLAITYRNEFLDLMRAVTGLDLFPASIYGFSQLPAQIMPGDVAIICGGSILICLLAAVLPARHASRLKPVEALRHE
jgi:lipoprotein-releasing system permease protein